MEGLGVLPDKRAFRPTQAGQEAEIGHQDRKPVTPRQRWRDDGIALRLTPDGNHDLAPRKASGWTVEAALDRTAEAADHFLRPL